MIAIDTNLLVYAHRSLCPEHQKAKTSIESAAANDSGWGIAHLPYLNFGPLSHILAARAVRRQQNGLKDS